MRTKEGCLVVAAFDYLVGCLADGDLQALRKMGIEQDLVEEIEGMRLADLRRAALSKPAEHFLKVNFDSETLRRILRHLQAERVLEETKRALVAADAPGEMMQVLYGMDGREYTTYRRMLDLGPSRGRPPEVDAEIGRRVWDAWRKHVGAGRDPKDVRPEDYLAVHRETCVSLRLVWTLVRKAGRTHPASMAVGSEPDGEGRVVRSLVGGDPDHGRESLNVSGRVRRCQP